MNLFLSGVLSKLAIPVFCWSVMISVLYQFYSIVNDFHPHLRAILFPKHCLIGLGEFSLNCDTVHGCLVGVAPFCHYISLILSLFSDQNAALNCSPTYIYNLRCATNTSTSDPIFL